jgi:hypothetical protein
LESKRAWASRNKCKLKAAGIIYRARPEYKDQRRACLARARQLKLDSGWIPNPPGKPKILEDEGGRLERTRLLARHRMLRHRMKKQAEAGDVKTLVRSNTEELDLGIDKCLMSI